MARLFEPLWGLQLGMAPTANVTQELWSMSDVVNMIEDWEAKNSQAGKLKLTHYRLVFISAVASICCPENACGLWSPHVELIALFVRAPLRSPKAKSGDAR